ncbi:MAG: response regulator [Fuerstiella sp.]|nr:response regulator [Fuerstiella sp.]
MSSIIIVDDALTDRTLISELLSSELNCEVQTAENGQVALDYIEAQRPDIVLTDLKMPGMDGLELLRSIKEDHPMIPVVLMTAQGSEELAADAMKAGATDYVPKRRLAEDLVRTVQRIIVAKQESMVSPQLMHRLEHCSQLFTLSNDPSQIGLVVTHLQCMLRCLPLSDETERIRVALALDAALSNALFHGNMDTGLEVPRPNHVRRNQLFAERWNQKPWCERRIRLTAEISRQQARFIVQDDGQGFDTSTIDPNVLSLESEGGRGLPLMYLVMDSVEFNSVGNEVTLIRNCVAQQASGSSD